MKLLPLVFYLLVFEPEGDKIKAAAITIALAFATFENVCYLIQNGVEAALRCICISELSFCAGDTAPVCLVLNNLVRGFFIWRQRDERYRVYASCLRTG